MSGGTIAWAIEALVASTMLMLLVLALRGPVRRAFGPDVAYALWLLPALRLMLPPLPHDWHERVAAPVARASQQLVILVDLPLGGGVAASSRSSMLGLAPVALWVLGAAAFLLWHTLAHVRFCRRMLAERDGDATLSGGVRVIATGAARGPLAFGVWHRYVAFPRDFAERYDADERDLALAHELGHHARGDLVANWAALVVLALHWFNPIAWRAFRAFRADQEIANDARVLAGRDAVTRHLYACAIVKAAHGGAVSAACHLHTIDDLKGRLQMLTTRRPSRARLAGGAGTLALLGVAALGVTASGSAAAERMRAHVEKATGVELAALRLPAAFQSTPAAPEAPTAVSPVAPATPAAPAAPVKKRYRVIVRTPDGAVEQTEAMAPMAPMAPIPPVGAVAPVPPVPPMPPLAHRGDKDWPLPRNWSPDVPQVSSASCPGADATPPVIHKEQGGKRVVIICTNRIEHMASRAAAQAQHGRDVERHAYASALEGLRSRRNAIAGDADMGEEGRREALAGIDDAIRELESDLAHADRD